MTIETESGRRRTRVIDERTRIELEDDFLGTIADLQVDVEVEAKGDSVSGRVFKVEVKEPEDEEEKVKTEGVIVLDGIVRVDDVTIEVTIETEGGIRRTVVVGGQTRVELEDDLPGTRDDLADGQEVEARIDPVTGRAFKVELEDAGEEGEEGGRRRGSGDRGSDSSGWDRLH